MNEYRFNFSFQCPNNGQPIDYRLKIRTSRVIMVEDLAAFVAELLTIVAKPYHETIADRLHARFGGVQILRAFHHGVAIRTKRGHD